MIIIGQLQKSRQFEKYILKFIFFFFNGTLSKYSFIEWEILL